MITKRQNKILNCLIKEYIDKGEPISSKLLKKKFNLNVSPATIRNDLQVLTQKGFITQPHTSAGRIPTEKGYKYFVNSVFEERSLSFFIFREVEETREKIQKELQLAEELINLLSQASNMLHRERLKNKESILETLRIVCRSRNTYKKNIDLIEEILREFESF